MGDSKIGLCIVGCGTFARAHAEVACRKQDRAVLYFASRSCEKAAVYGQEYGAAGSFRSYEGAAKDPRVDALLFCTPHSLHRENLELAASYGKHVLIEKPIATTLDDAEAMQERAKKAGIELMVAENYRYMPPLQSTAKIIQEGAIGSLRAIHMQTTKYQRSTGWRLSREMMGGGALIDGGIHKVSALRMVAGDPHRISAVTPAKVFPEMEGEEAIYVLATYANGLVASINYSWAALGEPGADRFLAIGTEGYVQFDFYGSQLELHSLRRKERLQFASDLNGRAAMYDAFLDLVVNGQSSATSPEEAIGDLRFVLAGYTSVAHGGTPELFES